MKLIKHPNVLKLFEVSHSLSSINVLINYFTSLLDAIKIYQTVSYNAIRKKFHSLLLKPHCLISYVLLHI